MYLETQERERTESMQVLNAGGKKESRTMVLSSLAETIAG